MCTDNGETKPAKHCNAQSFIVNKQCKTQADFWFKARASEGMIGEQKTPLLFFISSSRDGIRFLLCVALQRVVLSFNGSVGKINAESK